MCRDTRDHASDAEADPDKRPREEPGRHTDSPFESCRQALMTGTRQTQALKETR